MSYTSINQIILKTPTKSNSHFNQICITILQRNVKEHTNKITTQNSP